MKLIRGGTDRQEKSLPGNVSEGGPSSEFSKQSEELSKSVTGRGTNQRNQGKQKKGGDGGEGRAKRRYAERPMSVPGKSRTEIPREPAEGGREFGVVYK